MAATKPFVFEDATIRCHVAESEWCICGDRMEVIITKLHVTEENLFCQAVCK